MNENFGLNLNSMKAIRISLVFILLFVVNTVTAQSVESIKGSVVDAKTKRIVAKAKFKIQNADSTKVYRAKSDAEGIFTFNNIPLGNYILVVDDRVYNRIDIPFELKEEHLNGYTFQPFEIGRRVSWMLDWGERNGNDHYWSHFASKFVMVIYFLCLTLILFYSILQLSLAVSYVKHKNDKEDNEPKYDPENTPKVTIQLPMYNELYVADRIIETVAAFDYPSDKFQIQVLDDSTDETVDVIAKKVNEIAAKGINIQHVHRKDRTGYKAGALMMQWDK